MIVGALGVDVGRVPRPRSPCSRRAGTRSPTCPGASPALDDAEDAHPIAGRRG